MSEEIAKRCPCKDCLKRHFNCHTMCQGYKEFRKDRDRIMNKRNIDNQSTPEPSRKMKEHIRKKMRWK